MIIIFLINQELFKVVTNFFESNGFNLSSLNENTCAICRNLAFLFPKFKIVFKRVILKKELTILLLEILIYQANCAFCVIATWTLWMTYEIIIVVVMSATLWTYEWMLDGNKWVCWGIFNTLFVSLSIFLTWFLGRNQLIEDFGSFIISFPDATNFENWSKFCPLKFINVMINFVWWLNKIWLDCIDTDLYFAIDGFFEFCID